MNHRAYLASLDADTRARMTTRSDRAGLAHLAGHLGVIAILGLWVGSGAPLWWLAILPLGIALVFLFTLEHECTHDTPFRSRWLNRVVGTLAGVVIFVPFTWFRYFHLAHHKWTNDPDNDPELESPRPETRRAYVLHLSGLPHWSAMIRMMLRQAAGRAAARYLPRGREPRVVWEARAHLAICLATVVLIAAGHGWLFWCWVLPLVLGQPFLRAYLLAEHGRCPPVADMFENTRTTYTGAAIRFIAWNMPYHAEHHVWPSVPFWRLPALNALTRDHLKVTSDGYAAFHRDYARKLQPGAHPPRI